MIGTKIVKLSILKDEKTVTLLYCYLDYHSAMITSDFWSKRKSSLHVVVLKSIRNKLIVMASYLQTILRWLL